MKIRYVAVGVCSRCGKEFVRPSTCTDAACDCQSVVTVPLHPAVILPSRLHKKLQRVAELAGIPFEKLVNAMLEEAGKQVLSGKITIKYRL